MAAAPELIHTAPTVDAVTPPRAPLTPPEPLIFEVSRTGRSAEAQRPVTTVAVELPAALRRAKAPALPQVSELQAVRHFTRLSKLNFSIDTHFYPLGSCTMKYNPRACNTLAMLPAFLGRHPLAPETHSQGFLACMYELQEILKDVTGMAGVSLTPMAGAQGEFAGVAMIRAYHRARNDLARTEILVPDAAHGTNPATATMLGMTVREIPTDAQGDVDLEQLSAVVGPQTAGIMLTNPSTLGVFERNIAKIAKLVHEAGGLLYYDGANLNAILGEVRPGDMGFDVIHMNLHKTFSTPHGGGGPGAGAVGVSERLLPFMPIPVVGKGDSGYRRLDEDFRPEIHDSDGLAMQTGGGEWIWRPLVNPTGVRVNTFTDRNPRGFGLLQRDHDFDHYQDDGAYYSRRPSLWVEPKGDWGPGAITLVELSTPDETNDNIVAFWTPEEKPQPGQELLYAYRLYWGREAPVRPRLATVAATRTGIGGVIGRKRTYFSKRFVVDFIGGDLPLLSKDAKVEPIISSSRGQIELATARPLFEINGWRVVFDLKPTDDSIEPIDLRMFLRAGNQVLSETWLYQFTPPPVAERKF